MPGEWVRIVRRPARTEIYTADFRRLGDLPQWFPEATEGALFAKVADDLKSLDVTLHGPGVLK